MKTKILFIGFVCCLVLQANAQTFNNTIVNDNSAWSTLSYGYRADENGDVFIFNSTEYHFFDGDSIFNEKTYKKVFSYRDELHLERFFDGLIREENKKTYFVYYKESLETLLEERILYDFSLEEGMDFKYSTGGSVIETFYVKQIDFVEINGIQKKRFQLARGSLNGPIRATWIEGVGSLNGLLFPNNVLPPGAFKTLLCYHQNDELIYKNPAYSECYYYGKAEVPTSVQTITINGCSVFPNPVDDILNISCSDNAISRIEIFDNLGRKVYGQTYKEIIDVSSFSKGLYLLKVYDTNGQVSVSKIIKK